MAFDDSVTRGYSPDDSERTHPNLQWEPSDDPRRPGYPSDVSDRQWQGISPFVTKPKALGRPRQHPLREVVDALNYRWQTGCSWRMLPHDFPPWATVYSYFRRWQRQGVLKDIRAALWKPQVGSPLEPRVSAATTTTEIGEMAGNHERVE